MRRRGSRVQATLWLALFVFVGLAAPVAAVDGVVEINQASVEAAGGFPFVIDRPGSYRLTSDLVVFEPGSGAIQVASSHVSLDLNGFRVAGCRGPRCAVSTGPGSGPGIGVDNDDLRRGVRLANGIVEGSAYHGVELGEDSVVRDVVVRRAGGSGIVVGASSLVADCVSSDNVENGVITRGPGAIVRDTAVADNGSSGILLQGAGVVSGSTARESGLHGIQGQVGSRLVGNVSIANEGHGIRCVEACSVEGNTVDSNAFDGINAHQASSVRGNVARANGWHGIRVSQGALAHGNTSYENEQRGLYVSYGTAGFRENVLRANGEGQVGGSLNGTALDLGANQCGGDGDCAGAAQP